MSSDRADVSVPILDKHYDLRSEEWKYERRRGELGEHLDEYSESDTDSDR